MITATTCPCAGQSRASPWSRPELAYCTGAEMWVFAQRAGAQSRKRLGSRDWSMILGCLCGWRVNRCVATSVRVSAERTRLPRMAKPASRSGKFRRGSSLQCVAREDWKYPKGSARRSGRLAGITVQIHGSSTAHLCQVPTFEMAPLTTIISRSAPTVPRVAGSPVRAGQSHGL